MSYKGIDYGLGRTNRAANGIRYGVISQNAVLEAWCDAAEPDFGEATCPKCGNEATTREGFDYSAECGHRCHYVFDADEAFGEQPNSWGITGEIDASCGESGDIFVTKSPFFTYAQFCSPCAPGACYLTNPLAEPDANNRAYCFGHDWFEGGKAPYPVYAVETGELVQP